MKKKIEFTYIKTGHMIRFRPLQRLKDYGAATEMSKNVFVDRGS